MLKYLFNKVTDLMLCNSFKRKKVWHRCFSCKFSEIFKDYFVEHARTGFSEMNQKNYLHKIYSHENTGDGVLFSAVVDMWAYNLSKKRTPSQMLFYENWEVLQNIRFTEQCCATVSDFLWHFQCVTCLINDKSV